VIPRIPGKITLLFINRNSYPPLLYSCLLLLEKRRVRNEKQENPKPRRPGRVCRERREIPFAGLIGFWYFHGFPFPGFVDGGSPLSSEGFSLLVLEQSTRYSRGY
jgi:hypothetical protein